MRFSRISFPVTVLIATGGDCLPTGPSGNTELSKRATNTPLEARDWPNDGSQPFVWGREASDVEAKVKARDWPEGSSQPSIGQGTHVVGRPR
ncbi:hypothetical protein B0H66DRAFT_558780 [Apodospora peruviana]|uniref:Uncharacterized protein n=1 Tax=Apodospora peruviana TaxID=516989 RepID=A0AAE0M4W2_9PEZI|nr:hypothetical protein B0H66DRAFT_558780 [Apodospora peruviana]